jgi:tetratricopeptide (TPR) repeat protein
MALAIDPKSQPVLEGLTADFMKRQDYASVAQLLQGAPRDEKLDIAMARALGLLGDMSGAEAVLKEALGAHPDSVALALALLVPMMKQHHHEDAIKLLKATLAKHPGNKDLEVQLLGLLVLGQHMDEARELGPKVLAELPNDPQVLYLNGLAVRSDGENDKAKELLEKAVQLKPDFTNFLYELGSTLVLLKQWPEAKQRLERAIELGATQPEAHLALAKTLRALGDAPRATEEMTKYQQIKQESESILEATEASAQGDQDLENGKVSEAVGHYREAIEGQPGNGSYQYKLAIALNRAGDAAGERHALEEAVKLDPRLPGAQNALGYLLSRDGDANGAVEHFRATVEMAPGWTEAWINLAAELAVTSHFAEARQAVAKALELDPANAQAKELSDQLARDPAAQQDHP